MVNFYCHAHSSPFFLMKSSSPVRARMLIDLFGFVKKKYLYDDFFFSFFSFFVENIAMIV